MRVWIEISSDYRFQKKLCKEEGLYAPAAKRYRTMMRDVRAGDIILHYITSSGTKKKSHQSAIVGVSTATSSLIENDSKLGIDIDRLVQLPSLISIRVIKNIEDKSQKLETLISMSFQRYLAEIEISDAEKILSEYEENIKILKKYPLYSRFF